MELKLRRIARKNGYTIGHLYVNGIYFSDTLEDVDRGLSSKMSLDELKRKKLAHITAIPTGRYQVTMNVVSPKMSRSNFYKQFGGGRVPRLLNVPAYEGILIHCGNTAKDTDGCILIGKNTKAGMVLDSKITYSNLYPLLEATSKRNEKIFITVE
jgi:hypothetical protein